MDLEEINKRVLAIRRSKGDDETAHGMEDQLREDFIASIAAIDHHHPILRELSSKAKIVLSTSEIEFARWCA